MTSFRLLDGLVEDADDGLRERLRPTEVPLPTAMPLFVKDEGGGMEVDGADDVGIVGSRGGMGGRTAEPGRPVEDEVATEMGGGAIDLEGAMEVR
jgi:hypothetical protein